MNIFINSTANIDFKNCQICKIKLFHKK